MNTWFFKIEGKSLGNSEINHPFGFFVNCLISTEKEITEVEKWIFDDLKNDGLDIVKLIESGKYQDFCWDKKRVQQELNELADEAKENPNVIHYSSFHTWEKIDNG